MQRLGRAAAAVLHSHPGLTAGALQRPAAGIQAWGLPSHVAAAASAGSCAQVHWLHAQAAALPFRAGSAACSSSGGRGSLHLSHPAQHCRSCCRPWPSSGAAWRRYAAAATGASNPLSVTVTPVSLAAAGLGGGQLSQHEQQQQQQQQQQRAAPAAPAGPIEGVCHRRNIQCGWKKIDFVLRMIRRSTVDDAMAQLSANPKRASTFVKHALANARGNAIYAGADPSKLWVAEAFVTKGRYQKRIAIMGRGRSGVKQTRFSHLNVRVRQADDAFLAAAALRRTPRLVAPIMARMQLRRRTPRAALAGRGRWGGSAAAAQQAQQGAAAA